MSLPLIVLMATISAGMIIYSVMPRKVDKRRKALQRLDGKTRVGDKKAPSFDRRKSGAMENLLAKAAPTLSRASMPKTEEARTNVRMKLANAGMRGQQTPAIFLASKTIIGIAFTAVALLIAMSMRMNMRNTLGLVAGCGAVGLMLPNLWLSLAIKSRKEKLAFGMPDSLDLLVVTVEAGLGLDAAMQRVADEMKNVHPELAEELILTTMETQVGLARAEALQNLAMRTDVPEMKSLTAILIQAERFGTSVAQAIRTHAEGMRIKRSQAAEERAAKTAVKLIVPLIMFIFPALFVVLAGPAMMKLFETLTNVSGGL